MTLLTFVPILSEDLTRQIKDDDQQGTIANTSKRPPTSKIKLFCFLAQNELCGNYNKSLVKHYSKYLSRQNTTKHF